VFCNKNIRKNNYKATVIKRRWYWQKSRHTNQWNRTESRKRPTQIWVLTKTKSYFYGEIIDFPTSGTGALDICVQKLNEPQPIFHTLYKHNPKWIINLNVNCTTIKCLEENLSAHRLFRDLRHDVMNMIHKRKHW
jgi:hypothetical protein